LVKESISIREEIDLISDGCNKKHFCLYYVGIVLCDTATAQRGLVAQFAFCLASHSAFCHWAAEFTNKKFFGDFFNELLHQPTNQSDNPLWGFESNHWFTGYAVTRGLYIDFKSNDRWTVLAIRQHSVNEVYWPVPVLAAHGNVQ
jgi:hypothetical protein